MNTIILYARLAVAWALSFIHYPNPPRPALPPPSPPPATRLISIEPASGIVRIADESAANLAQLKKELTRAFVAYRREKDAAAQREAHGKVKDLQRRIATAITAGAMPCPMCQEPPHGIEQPLGHGRFEYEIGCLACGTFTYEDGTIRRPRVRGGMIPKHAVDAWNGGPGFWTIVQPAVQPEPEEASE